MKFDWTQSQSGRFGEERSIFSSPMTITSNLYGMYCLSGMKCDERRTDWC